MSNERVLSSGVWGGSTPSFLGSGAENLGYWFEIDAPGELVGFKQYSVGTHPNFVAFQLWTADPILIAMAFRSVAEIARDPGGAGWRTTWLHPRCPLAASTPYLVNMMCTEFTADFGRLTSAPVVNDHFTVYQSGSSPEPGNGIYDPTTDSAGSYYSFINPPHDAVAGHLYGVDLMVEFDP